MNPRLPANGQDVSSMDIDDGAWDSNEMMRGDGDPEAEPIDDTDDDEVEDDPQDGEAEDAGDIDGDDDAPELEASEDEEAEGEEDQDDEGEEEEGEEELEALEPYAQWPEDFKEAFAELPPKAQHFVMNTARSMQADYTKKTQALTQERQYYGQLGQIISPRVQGWALNGMSPVQAIHQVLALSDYAAQDPVGFAQHLCRMRGVDLQAELAKGQQSDEYVDPQVQALRQPIAQVQAQLNQMRQEQVQREWQQQQLQGQAEHRQVTDWVDQFASRTDASGKPSFPFFDDVITDITRQVLAAKASGEQVDVERFYRIACHANPQISAKIAARSRASENVKRRREAEEAKNASRSSLRGSIPANGSIPTENMGVGDLLRAAWRGEVQ